MRSDMRPRAPRYLLAAVYCAFTAACYEHRLAADCSIVPHRPGPPLTNRPSYVACVEPRTHRGALSKKPVSGSRVYVSIGVIHDRYI